MSDSSLKAASRNVERLRNVEPAELQSAAGAKLLAACAETADVSMLAPPPRILLRPQRQVPAKPRRTRSPSRQQSGRSARVPAFASDIDEAGSIRPSRLCWLSTNPWLCSTPVAKRKNNRVSIENRRWITFLKEE